MIAVKHFVLFLMVVACGSAKSQESSVLVEARQNSFIDSVKVIAPKGATVHAYAKDMDGKRIKEQSTLCDDGIAEFSGYTPADGLIYVFASMKGFQNGRTAALKWKLEEGTVLTVIDRAQPSVRSVEPSLNSRPQFIVDRPASHVVYGECLTSYRYAVSECCCCRCECD